MAQTTSRLRSSERSCGTSARHLGRPDLLALDPGILDRLRIELSAPNLVKLERRARAGGELSVDAMLSLRLTRAVTAVLEHAAPGGEHGVAAPAFVVLVRADPEPPSNGAIDAASASSKLRERLELLLDAASAAGAAAPGPDRTAMVRAARPLVLADRSCHAALATTCVTLRGVASSVHLVDPGDEPSSPSPTRAASPATGSAAGSSGGRVLPRAWLVALPDGLSEFADRVPGVTPPPASGSDAVARRTPCDVPSSRRDLTGDVVAGKYRFDRQIGAGGFGAVYEATDLKLGTRVAIKVLSHAQQFRELRDEARRVGRLSHPNIVDWKAFDELEDGTGYFVMELIDGEELDEILLRESTLEPERAAGILLQILDALRAAHHVGDDESILHLDLKPKNVFVLPPNNVGEPERVKVIDFGIGQHMSAGQRVERPATVAPVAADADAAPGDCGSGTRIRSERLVDDLRGRTRGHFSTACHAGVRVSRAVHAHAAGPRDRAARRPLGPLLARHPRLPHAVGGLPLTPRRAIGEAGSTCTAIAMRRRSR